MKKKPKNKKKRTFKVGDAVRVKANVSINSRRNMTDHNRDVRDQAENYQRSQRVLIIKDIRHNDDVEVEDDDGWIIPMAWLEHTKAANGLFKVGDKVCIIACEMGDTFNSRNHHQCIMEHTGEVHEIRELKVSKSQPTWVSLPKISKYVPYVALKHVAGNGVEKVPPKFPANAISRTAALKAAKVLFPWANYISMHKTKGWSVSETVEGKEEDQYFTKGKNADIHVPIKWDGPWQDSLLPMVHFAEKYDMLGKSFTPHKDGSIELGCGDVITAKDLKQFNEWYSREVALLNGKKVKK